MPVTYKLNLTMSDGTQIDAGNIEIPDGPPGPTGAQGAPGNVFENFTSLKVDVTDATVSYVSPTAHITGAKLIGYGTNNEEIEMAIDIPIVAGENVTIDASEDNKSIQVSATGGGGGRGGSGKYMHYITLYSIEPVSIIMHLSIISSLTIIDDFLALTNELFSIGASTDALSIPATGYWTFENTIYNITNMYAIDENELEIRGISIEQNDLQGTANINSAQLTDIAIPI
jgi:hypothetical protein